MNELYHHGIKGQKWGVRRYQNQDGSYTSSGRKRYGIESVRAYRTSYDKATSMQDRVDKQWRDVKAARKQIGRTALGRTIASARNKTPEAKRYNKMFEEWSSNQDKADEQWRDAKEKYKETGSNRVSRVVNNAKYDIKNSGFKLSDKQKKAIKIGAVVAGTALAAYATYKIAGPKIAAYRNDKAIQASVSRSRTLLQTGNQNSRNMAKKTIFAANSRTRKAAVNRTFKELHTNSNNVYGIPMTKSVNVARPSWGKNSLGSRSSNFRVTGRAAINYGGNRSYTAKVRSDNAKIKKLTSEIMKDHPHMTTKSAEQYAWYQLWGPRASAYRR